MKTKFHLRISAGLVLALLVLTDCNKQLDLRPIGQLDNVTYYQTEKDFEAASLGPYSTLLNYYFDQFGLGWYQAMLFPDDDVRPTQGGESNEQESFNWNPNNGQFLYMWEQTYKGIMRANVVIAQLPKATRFTDNKNKARFEAEARWMRAYFYFLLATNFGNVPIVDKPITTLDGARVPSSKPGEVWDFIINDLTFAKGNLPATWNSENTGRVTKGAAAALLGKVYLYRAQWDNKPDLYAKAAVEFNEVVNSGLYSLVTKLDDNFSPNTENNKESIFEVQFTRGDFNPWLPVDFEYQNGVNEGAAASGRLIFWRVGCGPNNVCAPGANGLGYGQMHVTLPLQNAFEPNDPRRPVTIYKQDDFFVKDGQTEVKFDSRWSVTGSTPAKYIRQEDLSFRFPLNISTNNDRIIRYADVLLMLAEAELLGNNNIAKAASLINQVRKRADPTGNILAERPSTATKDQMFRFLQQERRVELALEGHRYNDLVRWHRANLIDIKRDIDFGVASTNNAWSPKHLIKPIPQRELDLNSNLVQNAEYR
jgi:hypothetical protein